MANESVLPVETQDQIHKLLLQANAIVELVGASQYVEQHQFTDDALSNACWAVRDMLREVSRLATGEMV